MVNIIIMVFEVLYLDFIRARGANTSIITLRYVNLPKMKCEGEFDCYSYICHLVGAEHLQCIESHGSQPQFLLLNETCVVVGSFVVYVPGLMDSICCYWMLY